MCKAERKEIKKHDGPIPSRYTLDKADAYRHKCWQTLPDKYFWRGDAYYM